MQALRSDAQDDENQTPWRERLADRGARPS
jgi:hypothetical protein